MKYYVYKRYGNNNLYWNYSTATWVERKFASIYTQEQKDAITRVEGDDGGNWHEVKGEPVNYGEAPKPTPVFMGDGCCETVKFSGYYWFKDKSGDSGVTYLSRGQLFQKDHMYVYIKEPNWP